jgi:hypothetical protein
MPLMIEFDAVDKPASVSFVLKRKKGIKNSGKFHATVESLTNKKGQDVLLFKPMYWLNNPGNTAMLKLRGKKENGTIEGTIKKKKCKTFTVQKLPCSTVPAACSEEALGPLYALMGNGKVAKVANEPKAAKIAKVAASPSPATQTITLPLLGDRQFKSLLKQLKAKPFQKGQLVILARWSNQYKMTSQQVATILKLQRFPSDQLEALKVLAGSVSDTENISTVLDVIRFREERKAAERIIFERRRARQLSAPLR